jgi:hypothetical protein
MMDDTFIIGLQTSSVSLALLASCEEGDIEDLISSIGASMCTDKGC